MDKFEKIELIFNKFEKAVMIFLYLVVVFIQELIKEDKRKRF